MQEEGQQENFRYRINDKDANDGYENDLQNLRLEKLSYRVTLISILIPCLIAVLLVIAYFDIKKRMVATQDTETRNVQRLSSNLEMQIEEIQAQIKGLNEEISKEIGSVKKDLSGLEKQRSKMDARLAKMEKSINSIDASKADKKDQDRYLAQLKTSLAPIGTEIQNLRAVVQENNENYGKKLQALTEVVQGAVSDTDAIGSRMEKISKGKVDRDTLDLELLKAKKAYQLEISNLVKSVQANLANIYRELGNLKKAGSIPSLPPPVKPPAKKPAELPSLGAGGSGAVEGENLSEQDIP